MVICLERDADLHMAQLMPLPLTVSCFSKIEIGFTFLVLADPGSPGKRAVECVCVCVCVRPCVRPSVCPSVRPSVRACVWKWVSEWVSDACYSLLSVLFVIIGLLSHEVKLKLLVGRQEGHPACKNREMGCWHGYLSGVRCRLVGPADATATHCHRLVLPFWYQLTWAPG